MKRFLQACRMLLMLSLVTGILYPACVWGMGNLLFPQQAKGSLVYRDGVAVGSSLIGQEFSAPGYFHARPSNSNYDALQSGGSNLAVSNEQLYKNVRKELQKVYNENVLSGKKNIPADLVTRSASGLDPHISESSALLQVPRIAKNSNLSEVVLQELVAKNTHTNMPWDDGYVNVLELNMALLDLK